MQSEKEDFNNRNMKSICGAQNVFYRLRSFRDNHLIFTFLFFMGLCIILGLLLGRVVFGVMNAADFILILFIATLMWACVSFVCEKICCKLFFKTDDDAGI